MMKEFVEETGNRRAINIVGEMLDDPRVGMRDHENS